MTDEPKETKEERTVSRREFLKYAGLAGGTLAAAGGIGGLIAACGETATTTTGATTATTAGGPTTTAAGPTTSAAGPTTSASTGPEPPAQDKIVIGAARPLSGVNKFFEDAHFGPAYKLWVKDINDAGGLKVAGKPLPIEMKVFDDQSDLDTSLRLQTQLMEQDKVDFMFAPCSTAFLFASAALQNDHKYIFMSAEGGATTLEKELQAGELPWVFQFLNYSDHNQLPVMGELCQELGIKTMSSMYIDDLHGIEYSSQAAIFLASAGVKVMSQIAVPPDIKDVSSIVKKIQGENPDLVCSFQYPPGNGLTIGTMAQLNYNPKAVLVGPGGSTQVFYDGFKGAMDGCMFEGAWTPKGSPEIQAYYDKLVAFVGDKGLVDFWGPLIYRAELEFFQQAIEKAATLDRAKIAEVMRTAHFKTIMSQDTFMNPIQILDSSSYAGQIGQWQNGYPEIIDKEKRTTDKVWYPKPTWADAPNSATSSTT